MRPSRKTFKEKIQKELNSLGPAIQPVSNPMKRAPVQVKSSQFLEENAVIELY